jgi:quercetin dioxygenase-like cupin family protein
VSGGAFPEPEGRQEPIELICSEFAPALAMLRAAGLRLDELYPADEPHAAVLSCPGARLRLTNRPDETEPGDGLPKFRPGFVVTRDGAEAGEGRAGMRYRDLVPSRLGGRYIASHITIPEGGPVDDWVHYHGVALQLIYVAKGWVRVVYEDQGEPFVMQAGDLVLQPPFIRHRVLESSPGLEVIEIGCPAVHKTFSDHDLDLPTIGTKPERLFHGQRFLRHRAAETSWTAFHGAEAQESGMRQATGGLAEVRTIRPAGSPAIEFPAHDGELIFGFVLDGTVQLEFGESHLLAAGDAFVIPPGEAWRLEGVSANLRLLQVTTGHMPGQIPAGR